MPLLSEVSGERLLRDLHRLAGSQRRVMAELVLHLGEMDARRLYAGAGFPSLFAYCVEALRFSEDEACRRIEAARLARRFPAILPLLETGAVTLTVLGLLKRHLTLDTQAELLAGVSGKSARRAEEWLAVRSPRPDVPESIRKLPGPRALPPGVRDAPSRPAPSPAPDSPPAPPQPGFASPAPPQPAFAAAGPSPAPRVPVALEARPDGCSGEHNPAEAPSGVAPLVATAVSPLQAERARVTPLSQDRFLVKLTVSLALKEKLELARDLMSHGNPSGNLALVVERALDVLLATIEQKKLGYAKRPDSQRMQRVAAQGSAQKEAVVRARVRSHVARSTRRTVVAQDGLRCSFVAPGGHRCEARAFLEFDHVEPRGLGGGSEPHNIRIFCRAHNRLAAERLFGKGHVARKIETSRAGGVTMEKTRVSSKAEAFPAEPGESRPLHDDAIASSAAEPGRPLHDDAIASSAAEAGESRPLHDDAIVSPEWP